MSFRAINFSAGPSTLPLEVMEEVQKDLLNYRGSGMSVMEMSHRWKEFDEIYQESITDLRRIAAIPDTHDILYMTGGASAQFALIPMNLSGPGGRVGFIHTGIWSKKAMEQAKIQGVQVDMFASSEGSGFDRIPQDYSIPDGLDYIHITSNNTIYGTQYRSFPAHGKIPLVIDMSSDFLSQPVDWTGIGVAYAGMQKNAGPSGATVVVMDRSLYEREKESTPTLFRYSTYAKSDSMFNTPPTFQIYVFALVLKWLEKRGGLTATATYNEKKAAILYEYLEKHPEFYKLHAQKNSRSLMNVTFYPLNRDLEKELVAGADARNLRGIKGHKSIGGMRASIYNAMTLEGCQALVEYLDEFRRSHS